MEKLVFKKITSIFISICIVLFVLFSVNIVSSLNKSAISDLEEMISQIEVLYNKTKENIEETTELFKDDYLNRAYAIDFIISNTDDESLNNDLLSRIKNLMEVSSIHIIDHNGEIKLSSDLESIGLNLMSHDKANKFWDLIKSNDKSENIVEIDGKSIVQNKDNVYIGVKSTNNKYSVIQIALDRNILDNYLQSNYISKIVENTPTIYERAIFIVNKTTGNIDGITQNNETVVNIDDINSKSEFIEKLNECNEGKLIKINDKFRFLKTENVDNYIIAAYVDANLVYRTLIKEIAYLFLCILVMLACITIICKYAIKEYVLRDIFSIESNVKQLMKGNYEAEFKTKYDTELRNISKILNHWKEEYTYRENRMTRVISSLNSNASIFECVYTMNRSFFSDNMKEILGLNNDEWEKVSKTPKDFEDYINSLLKMRKSKYKLIAYNNKFLNIEFFKEKDEFYGIIMDKTQEEKLRLEIEKELIEKEREAQTDPLTKLLNRLGLEKSIKGIIENTPGKAILIMFDLDNFKTINDKLGHPTGDEVLKIFARCLKLFFDKNAFISRIAGDEFVVFIDRNISKSILEQTLRSLMKQIHIKLNKYYKEYKLSTSIGVVYVDKEIDTYKEIYKRVDNALYTAKNLGKDTFYIE